MNNSFYISEPTTINTQLIEEILKMNNIKGTLHEGVPKFSGENLAQYTTLVIRSETVVSKDIKNAFPNLENIIRVGTGLDNVDVEYCHEVGINVYNAAGANADAVSEYVVTMILYVLRRLYLLDVDDLNSWNRFKFLGNSIKGQTVGLIGFGNVGRLLYEKLKAFHCNSFVVYDPYVGAEDLPEGVQKTDTIDGLIKQSSIISLHLPLNENTKNTIDKARLESFKENTILINAARGGIVDENAVIEVLSERPDIIYIADTVSDEPHGDRRLFTKDNIIITPHIASLSYESERAMHELALQNFIDRRNAM